MSAPLDLASIRADFPVLEQQVRGKPLVFLDSAASAQKPRLVIEAVSDFYSAHYASVHRGLYQLSAEATRSYEAVREKVQHFIGAADAREIVFVRNATEAVNLVAHSWGRANLSPDDEILITAMEHHANIVPWQLLCEAVSARLVVAPMDDRGDLILDEFEKRLSPRTRLVALAHVSNALGTINPVRELAALARARSIPVLVDGAQAVPHMPVDVQRLGCDFYVFSGHKLFGPTGAGVLWGRLPLLEAMPPFLGGGSMIASVTFEKTTYAPVPQKFEAGTPDIAGVIGLGAAIDYLNGIGMERVDAWEHELLLYATAALERIPKLRIIGTADRKAAVISFVLEDVHPHDIATVLDQEGIAIRAGHHCAQPTMARFGIPATARASFAFYNTKEDVDALVKAIHKVLELFG